MRMKNVHHQLLGTPERRLRLELEAKRRKTSVARVIKDAVAGAPPRARHHAAPTAPLFFAGVGGELRPYDNDSGEGRVGWD